MAWSNRVIVQTKYPRAYAGGEQGAWMIWVNDYDEVPLGRGPTARQAWADAARNLEKRHETA